MEFTRHALQRFTERFRHLHQNNVSHDFTMRDYFRVATIDKSFKNNTAYMVYLLEKYGHNDFEFRVHGDILFICKSKLVITIVDRNDTTSGGYKNHGENRSRFKKRSVSA